MNKKELIAKESLDNRAKLESYEMYDHSECEQCSEEYIFQMKDNYHSFSVGLTTILSCLAFAERQGAVPPLPGEWWLSINGRY